MTDPKDCDHGRTRWRTESQWQLLQRRIRAATAGRSSGQGLEIDPGPPRLPRVYIGAAAACAIFALALLSRGGAKSDAPLQWAQFATGAAQQDSIRLGDSTMVVLGPSTTLRYAMNASRREVELKGVASFEVTHDAERPFRVRAGNAIAIDLGTRFVIRHYESDATVNVLVSAGVVSLSDTAGSAHVTLGAGTAGKVARNGATSLDQHADSTRNELWLRGQLQFTNATLGDAAIEIGNWYGVRVAIPDTSLANRRVTALYTRASLDGVLSALAATLDISYTEQNEVIILQPRVHE